MLKTWEFLAPLRTWGAYWTNRGAQRSGQLAVGNCNIVQLQSVERWWKHVKKLSGSSHSSSSSSRRPKVLQISLSFNVFDFTIIENFLIPSVLGTDLRTRSTCPFATEGHMWSSLLCGRAAMCNLVANEFIWMAHGDLSPANWWIYLVCDPVILYNCCKTNSSGSPTAVICFVKYSLQIWVKCCVMTLSSLLQAMKVRVKRVHWLNNSCDV